MSRSRSHSSRVRRLKGRGVESSSIGKVGEREMVEWGIARGWVWRVGWNSGETMDCVFICEE